MRKLAALAIAFTAWLCRKFNKYWNGDYDDWAMQSMPVLQVSGWDPM